MCARREAVERSEILDGHRSEGYGNVGGSDPCHNGSLPPFMCFWPPPQFGWIQFAYDCVYWANDKSDWKNNPRTVHRTGFKEFWT